MAKHGADDQGQTFEPSEIKIEGEIELVGKIRMKHPNFGRPSARQAFYAIFPLFFKGLRPSFLSCSVIKF